MGTFVGRSVGFDQAAVAEEMRPALYSTFNAQVQFIDPNMTAIDTPYDPTGDTGGQAVVLPVVYDTGENGALLNQVRLPHESQGGGMTISLVAVRVQMKMPDPPVFLRAGLRMKVVNGGNAHSLEHLDYEVSEDFDTSIAWGSVLTATVVTSGS